MLLPLQDQFRIVISSVLAGLLTGILFDLYRIIRGRGVPKIIVVIEDILFWILCGIVIFIFLLKTNFALLGPYVYALIILGVSIYLTILSKSLFKVEKKIISGILKILRILGKNIRYTFKNIFVR